MLYTNINTNLSIFDWGLGYSIGLCDLSHHFGKDVGNDLTRDDISYTSNRAFGWAWAISKLKL